ncbi:hypothetical protein D3C78_1734080 [compost metagenome]
MRRRRWSIRFLALWVPTMNGRRPYLAALVLSWVVSADCAGLVKISRSRLSIDAPLIAMMLKRCRWRT